MVIVFSGCSLAELQPQRVREMRAAWITTVFQLDYPKTASTNPTAITEQYRQLLIQLKASGINTVFFQVRTAGDAFYASRIVPWSRFLTGKEGMGPDDQFDPLPRFIELAHEYNIEFHAWLNPFRVTTNLDTSLLAKHHIYLRHPEYTFEYAGKLHLDPGNPAVRAHFLNVVEELLDNYELDGIHLDDYFYPYPKGGKGIPDTASFDRYGKAFFDITDWRRANVNTLIRELHQLVKQKQAFLALSVSPFGVWRTIEKDERGTPISSALSSYDDLYADALLWSAEGWVDFIIPQLYWEIGHPTADFGQLLNWWVNKVDGKKLIIGHAAYKSNPADKASWENPEELLDQYRLTLSRPEVAGNAFFRAKNLNYLNLRSSLDSFKRLYSPPVLLPELKTELPRTTVDIKFLEPEVNGGFVQLCWRVPRKTELPQGLHPKQYALFRFEGFREEMNLEKARLLFVSERLSKEKKYCFTDRLPAADEYYSYAVAAIDHYNRILPDSTVYTLIYQDRKVRIVAPRAD